MSAQDGFAGWEKRVAELDALLDVPAKAFDARPLEEMRPDCPTAFARLSEVLRQAAAL